MKPLLSWSLLMQELPCIGRALMVGLEQVVSLTLIKTKPS